MGNPRDTGERSVGPYVIAGLVLLVLGMAGVWGILQWFARPALVLDLDDRLPPTPPAIAAPGQLRAAVATMFSPRDTYTHYARLVELVGRDVGRPASLIVRPTYKETREAILSGAVDVALVCTGPYVLMAGTGRVELLVQPELRPGLTFHAAVIVPADSPAQSLDDLRERTFGYADPESFTGCFLVRDLLRRRGQEPDSFFGKGLYTGSHDRSVQAVVNRFVDGASVHSLVLAGVLAEHPDWAGQLRVIWRSEAYGPPPVVVPAALDPALKTALRTAFLRFHETPEGPAILQVLGVERFVAPRPADYASALALYQAAAAAAAPPAEGRVP